jgi:hypothetical protein
MIQLKEDIDFGFNVNGFTVQCIRPIDPLLHRVQWQVALDKEEGFVKHIFGKEILGGAQAPRKRPKSG